MGKPLVGPDMNLHIGMVVPFLALILLQGCTGKDDPPTSQQEGGITQEEGLIVTTLNEVATAESQFYSTKDSLSILRFYAQDYVGIKDGKSETLNDKSKYLVEVLDQIKIGEPIGISSKVMNIKPSVAGRFGWATYEYEYKVGRSGGRSGVLHQVSQGHCTAIFTKQADAWRIRHEHCSTANPTPFFLDPK
jgi:ketosteroid isomerase-like protein